MAAGKRSDRVTRTASRSTTATKPRPRKTTPSAQPTPSAWIESLASLADTAMRIAGVGRDPGSRGAGSTPEQLRMMATAGDSLRDVREVAGLTVTEIVRALDLRDKSVWEAIEDGREALSIELILRLASLLARNDPLPFVLRMARSYQPRLWSLMQELGLEGLPLQLEREREFINIFRRHDAARALSDPEWSRLLSFTRQAFELGLGMLDDRKLAASIRAPSRQKGARRGRRRTPAAPRGGNSR